MVWSNVEKLCRDLGITVTKLERDIGLSKGCVSHWKGKKTVPSYGTLKKLSSYFGVSIDELVS